jgi:hypothetical protein
MNAARTDPNVNLTAASTAAATAAIAAVAAAP